MQVENANKSKDVYNAMFVLQSCNIILGITSPRYPGYKYHILMLIKFLVVQFTTETKIMEVGCFGV